jgi:hypothetical protein
MTKLDHPLARRSVIKGAGLGLVAGGMASTMPSQGSAATGEEGEIWSSEYWAKKGKLIPWTVDLRVAWLAALSSAINFKAEASSAQAAMLSRSAYTIH